MDKTAQASPKTQTPLAAVAGIKSFDHDGLLRLVKQWGQPSYRVRQIEQWLYKKFATSFSEMTDLPAVVRTQLVNNLTLPTPSVVRHETSRDGTRKYLLQLADGARIEAVGIPDGMRLTVCFSTQAGCNMGCVFCATGRGRFVRNLAPGEMVDQVNIVAQDFKMRASHAVAMGQGEPFANYDASLGALRFINSPDGLGIGARHLTISTCGLIPQVRRFASEPEQFTLAVSLHSAIQTTRDRLMPKLSAFPLGQLRLALIEYAEKTGRRPSLEFVLIRDLNDTQSEFDALLAFCRGMLCHVNLIPLNAVGQTDWQPTPPKKVQDFARALQHYGIETTVRISRGNDIAGACGQLAGR